MLQNKFEMPLDLIINDSKILVFYSYLLIFLSTVSIFISSLSTSVQIILVFTLFSFAWFSLKKKKSNRITSLNLSNSDEWEIEINNNERFDAELHDECVVTSFLLWLNFTTSNSFGRKKVFHIILLSDSADKDLLRKLRVRLRFLKNKIEDAEENILVD